MALAGPPVVAGRLGAPVTPHPSLVLGAGTLGLGLGGSRASLLRSLPVSLGQVIPKVPLLSWVAGRELPLLLPSRGVWKLLRPRL